MIADAEDDVSELIYEWSSSIDGVIDVNTTVESDGSMLGSAYLSEEIHLLHYELRIQLEKHRQQVLRLVLVDQTAILLVKSLHLIVVSPFLLVI